MQSSLVWQSLDELPIWNWDKTCKESDLRYLQKDYSDKKVNVRYLSKVYQKIEEEYINNHVLNTDFKDEVETKKDALLIKIEAVLLSDKTLNNIARATEAEIEKIQNKKEIKLDETLAILEKFLGFYLDPKIVSVTKYYTYIDLLVKEAKKAKRNG